MNNEIESTILEKHSINQLLNVENESTPEKLCKEAWMAAKEAQAQVKELQTKTILLEVAGLALAVGAIGASGYYMSKRFGLGSITGLQKIAEAHEYLAGWFKGKSVSRIQNNAFWAQSGEMEKVYGTYNLGDVHGYNISRGITDTGISKQTARPESMGTLTKRFSRMLF